MSKKEVKPKRDLSIPMLPDTIFVIELEAHVFVTGFPVDECVFPMYRFDDAYSNAFEAAKTIATANKKLIVNAVDFNINDPHIYDPIRLDLEMQNLMRVFATERKKIAVGRGEQA